MLRIEDEIVYCDDPNQYKREEFGKVVSFDSVMQNPVGFLEIFSEGSPALKSLLKYSWTHGVQTLGCCIGHESTHTYYKDTFFGGSKVIDEETYLAHATSDRYHDVFQTESHAYFAFEPGDFGTKEELAEILEQSMRELAPDLKFFADYGKKLNIVTITTEEVIPQVMREKFFSDLKGIMSRDIIPLRISSKDRLTTDKKPSLNEQIETAAMRISSHAPQTKIKSIEAVR